MSAHDDYLDPDRHLWREEDYGSEDIKAELKKRDSKRWRWDAIDCCWTGKDADLEACGQQGCILISVDDEFATVEVHAGKTFAGTDVTLNLPRKAENSNATHDKVLDVYMEQAEQIACNCGSFGEWDGDSWYMTHKGTIKVPVIPNEDGSSTDAEKTADAIIAAAEASLEAWEKEIAIAGDALEVLSGWKKYNKKKELIPCREGRPGPGSAWAMYRASK